MRKTKPIRASVADFNGILEPLIKVFELKPLTDIAYKDKTDALLIWNDILYDYHLMCITANMNDIMTFVVQHGKGGMRDYLDGLHKPIANVAYVWTEEDKKTAIKGGWKPESVFVVGAPWFSRRPKRNKKKGMVVFDAVHWDKEVTENYDAWKLLNQIPNIKPVAKLIEGHDPKKFGGDYLQTNRSEWGHLIATYELIAQAEVVVCMMEGTMELLAYSLGVPVIFLKGFKHTKIKAIKTYQGKEDCKPSKATTQATFGTLPLVLKQVMDNPEKKKKEMKNELAKWAGNPDTDKPIQKIAEITKMIVNKHKEEL